MRIRISDEPLFPLFRSRRSCMSYSSHWVSVARVVPEAWDLSCVLPRDGWVSSLSPFQRFRWHESIQLVVFSQNNLTAVGERSLNVGFKKISDWLVQKLLPSSDKFSCNSHRFSVTGLDCILAVFCPPTGESPRSKISQGTMVRSIESQSTLYDPLNVSEHNVSECIRGKKLENERANISSYTKIAL